MISRGLIDTSVVIDAQDPQVAQALPAEVAVTTITLAELASGPVLTRDPQEQARRQIRLQQAEALFGSIDFDVAAARSYGLVVATAAASGRSHRQHKADFMIAAVAHSHGLALYTRNPDDFRGLEDLISIHAV